MGLLLLYIGGWMMGLGTGIILTVEHYESVEKNKRNKYLRDMNVKSLYPDKKD